MPEFYKTFLLKLKWNSFKKQWKIYLVTGTKNWKLNNFWIKKVFKECNVHSLNSKNSIIIIQKTVQKIKRNQFRTTDSLEWIHFHLAKACTSVSIHFAHHFSSTLPFHFDAFHFWYNQTIYRRTWSEFFIFQVPENFIDLWKLCESLFC